MKATKVVLILFLMATPLASAQDNQDNTEATTLIKAGAKLPAFTVKTLEGKTIDSHEFQGKVVLVNFWATWCGPCRTEMPLLQKEVYEAFKDKGFLMIAISRGETEAVVKEFIAANKYTFPIGLDPEKKAYNLFASQYIPRSFVVDKNGIVKRVTVGYEKKEFAAMVALIKTMLDR